MSHCPCDLMFDAMQAALHLYHFDGLIIMLNFCGWGLILRCTKQIGPFGEQFKCLTFSDENWRAHLSDELDRPLYLDDWQTTWMDLKDSLSRFKQQQERCQSSLASIALTSKPKHRAQPINAPSVPARPSQPIKFSNDTERLQHINSIRKSPVGAQMKLVIELLYKSK
ncbi:hypothetical protein SEVIR_9G257438v4 [Setaria viridis]